MPSAELAQVLAGLLSPAARADGGGEGARAPQPLSLGLQGLLDADDDDYGSDFKRAGSGKLGQRGSGPLGQPPPPPQQQYSHSQPPGLHSSYAPPGQHSHQHQQHGSMHSYHQQHQAQMQQQAQAQQAQQAQQQQHQQQRGHQAQMQQQQQQQQAKQQPGSMESYHHQQMQHAPSPGYQQFSVASPGQLHNGIGPGAAASHSGGAPQAPSGTPLQLNRAASLQQQQSSWSPAPPAHQQQHLHHPCPQPQAFSHAPSPQQPHHHLGTPPPPGPPSAQQPGAHLHAAVPDVVALLQRLVPELSDVVAAVLQEEYEELWLDVVCEKPPWDWAALLHLLHKHWRSTFKQRLHLAAEAAVEFLQEVRARGVAVVAVVVVWRPGAGLARLWVG